MTSDITNPPPRRSFKRPAVTAGVLIAVLALGAAGGAAASHYIHRHYPQSVLLLQPKPIAQMTSRGPVALKGTVAEVFGGKFIIADASGRALVDTGPRGDNVAPVTKDETVTVQGYFDHGVIHAAVLTRADGSSEAFGPPARRRAAVPACRSALVLRVPAVPITRRRRRPDPATRAPEHTASLATV